MALQKILRTDNAEQFKFEKVGDKIVGHFITTQVIVIDGRDTNKHVFQVDGGMLSTLGSYDLNEQLASLKPGIYVEIEFVGTKKTKPGRKPMKLFDVAFDEEQIIDVGKIASAPAPVAQEEDAAEEAEYSEEESLEAGAEEIEEEQETPAAVTPRVVAGPKRTTVPTSAARERVQAMLKNNRVNK